jgi:DNA modification methylase
MSKTEDADLEKDFKEDPNNANKHTERGHAFMGKSIAEFGAARSLVADKNGVIIAGNATREALVAAGIKDAVVVKVEGNTPVIVQRMDWDSSKKKDPSRRYGYADNRASELGLEWNPDQIKLDLGEGVDLAGLFSEKELEQMVGGGQGQGHGSLAERFLVPPFSVLDARQGYWQDRKRTWLNMGIQSEEGRGENLLNFSDAVMLRGKAEAFRTKASGTTGTTGTSIFDPVLCELIYRWFCPSGGAVLDPFAGGSVRGIVASCCGLSYDGIDLRPEQLQANEKQAAQIKPGAKQGPAPRWLLGNSLNMPTIIAGGENYDLVFSCPPYFDLEQYSDDPQDLSNLGSYPDFLRDYNQIIEHAVARLRSDRFACFVVGDIRDKQGFYRNFVSDTIAAFEAVGAKLYNEAILVTACGTLPLRVARSFPSGRKLGKTHQNVLIFFKGDPSKIKDVLGPVEVELPAAAEDAQ